MAVNIWGNRVEDSPDWPETEKRMKKVLIDNLLGGTRLTIAERINAVVEARGKLKEALTLRHDAYQQWEKDNAFILDDEADARLACQEAEGKLREMAVETYLKTLDKAVAPGVGIRVLTRLDYDSKVAMDWAVKHSLALALDKKAFEAIAATTTLDFVVAREEPTATIATELKPVNP